MSILKKWNLKIILVLIVLRPVLTKIVFVINQMIYFFKGKVLEENIEDLKPEDYYLLRCKQHSGRKADKVTDRGYNLVIKHYGNINDDVVVAKSEEQPDVQLAQVLAGNTVDVITTPSKAKKSASDKNYIDQDNFLDEAVVQDENIVVIRLS